MKRTPLKPGKPPARRKPINKRNRKRMERRFVEGFESDARVKWFRMQECANCGGWPSVCAHVKSRGAGGTAADIIPLCPACHQLQHTEGWGALTIVDPAALAAEYDERYRRAAA